jgi:thioredoxin 1
MLVRSLLDRALIRAMLTIVLLFAALAPAPARAQEAYDAQRFAAALATGGVVIVHVHASWCPVCKKQRPIIAALAAEPALAAVRFVAVDFDREKAFLRASRVANQSVILLHKGGKEARRLIGTTEVGVIRSAIAELLAK